MREPTKHQVKCRLKKGDDVIVTSGKCRGETGKIERVDRKTSRVFLSGINLSKRHTKPSMSSQTGGIIDKAMPLSVSIVALLDPKKKKATRIGYKMEGDKKVRFAVASGTILT